jgi:hypothetical protein
MAFGRRGGPEKQPKFANIESLPDGPLISRLRNEPEVRGSIQVMVDIRKQSADMNAAVAADVVLLRLKMKQIRAAIDTLVGSGRGAKITDEAILEIVERYVTVDRDLENRESK